MTDPRNVREVNIARKGLEERVDLLQKWLWAIVAFLGTILVVAAAIWTQITDLKTEIAVVKTGVTTINDRLSRIEKSVDDIRRDGGQILSRIARLEPAPRPSTPPIPPPTIVAGFYVSADEAMNIRELLQAPQKTGSPPKFGMWERLPDQLLRPIPENLIGKVPKLKGLRYAIDPNNNAIALVEPTSNSVIAII